MSRKLEVYENTLANLSRYLQGEGIETTRIVRPNIYECHANRVGQRLEETVSQPLSNIVEVGIEYCLTKSFSFRTFLSRVSRIELNPLGILRGNFA